MPKIKHYISFLIKLFILIVLLHISGCLKPLTEGDVMFQIRMPGQSYQGLLEPLNDEEQRIKDNLFHHIHYLAHTIGERNITIPGSLDKSAEYIAESFASLGYDVSFQEFESSGQVVRNIEVEMKGRSLEDEILVIGAHYDSVAGAIGANDNGSGVAAVLELARLLKDSQPERTIRFVAFVNEEPPYFQTNEMGSLVYAKRSHEREENIVGMMSIETIGYYSDKPDSQKYPFPLHLFYPSEGNFIGFISNYPSRKFLTKTIGSFRDVAKIPSEGAAITQLVPGVGWSDHWSFWQYDYPAIMITDTAPYRYPHYHTYDDTVDKVNTENAARVVSGMVEVIRGLGK